MNKRIHSLLLRSGAASYAAFTLLEVLVAVAALAVLAVGMAAIFDTTGKTVEAGRRVSNFAAAAALIEQQLRQDINSMTREGFLVIKNQYADVDASGTVFDTTQPGGDRVLLSEEDTAPRLRRIDEMMFFSKGTFRSVRGLLDPDYVAQSDAARIYYGHGRRMKRDLTTGSEYLRPSADFTFQNHPNETNSFLGFIDADNPNQFASDWILLRHITLLRPPRTTVATPTGLPPSIPAARVQDSDIQIALQPASSSVFRALNGFFPAALPPRVRDTEGRPDSASGIVDIATIDLREIRAIVGTTDVYPNAASANFYDPASNQGNDGSNAGPDGLVRIHSAGGDTDLLFRMHAWMEDAFPAFSMGTGNAKTRIRCEFAPTDYVGIAASGLTSPEIDYRRADQLALTSFNFLPRCTEFIVEWSMGGTFTSDPSSPAYIADRAGEVIWYGMRREVGGRIVAQPYASYGANAATLPWSQPMVVPLERHVTNYRGEWINSATYVRGDGVTLNGTRYVSRVNSNTGNTPQPGGNTQWFEVNAAWPVPVDPNLIHGIYDATDPFYPIANFFAWNDPTFDPEGASATKNGVLDQPEEAAAPTVAWPWPKMIRITLSLADPADPTVEQTFQFVFDVPAGHEGR